MRLLLLITHFSVLLFLVGCNEQLGKTELLEGQDKKII
jgi:hypothetical protein